MPPELRRRRSVNVTDRTVLKAIATMAAQEAVKQTFITLGVDLSTPTAVVEAQELFMSLRNLRRDWQRFRNGFIGASAAAIATAGVALILHFHSTPPV